MQEQFEYLDDYNNLKNEYSKLIFEHTNYEKNIEKTVQEMSKQIVALEKKADILTNIIEVSKYINTYLYNDNQEFLAILNDMIIGVLGVSFSTIYVKEKNDILVRATNLPLKDAEVQDKEILDKIQKGEPYKGNYKKNSSMCYCRIENSVMGVPINRKNTNIGYILVEHESKDFFTDEHTNLMTAIASQMAIVLENNVLYNKLKIYSEKDFLLNISNRRHFYSMVEKSMKENPKKQFSIVMIDFDDFKKVNDIYGHLYGDEALVHSINIIKQNLGRKDLIGRYGGEEIIIYMPHHTCSLSIREKVEILRSCLEGSKITLGENRITVTASFGIASYPKDGESLQNVINKADKALYEAKDTGKNKVVCFSE